MGVRVGVANFCLRQSIGNENCGRHKLGRFVGIRVGVAYSRNTLAPRTRPWNLNLNSQFSIFDSFRDIRVYIYVFLMFVGGLWAVCGRGKLLLGIDENNAFQLKFLF